MKSISTVLLLTSVLFSLNLTAAEEAAPRRFTLKEAQAYAVVHSTETENARIDVLMAKKKTWETTAIGLPQISAKLSYTDMLKIPTTLIPAKFFDPDAGDDEFIDVKFGTQHNATLELTASQLVFNGSYIVGLQAAKVYQQLSKNQLEKKEIEIRETVANTYYLVLMAEKNLAILEETRENLKQNLYEIEEMLKAGFCEDADVDQVRLSLTDLETMFSSTRRQVDMAYRLLKFQMGLELDSRIELSENLEKLMDSLPPPSPEKPAFDITKHIDFRVMATMEQSMALLLKKEKSEFLPTISAFLTYSQSAMRDKFNFFSKEEKWFPSSILGLNVSLPIFSSGQRLARVAQARLDLQKATNQKEQVADGLRLALEQAQSDYQDAFSREKSTAESLALAKRIYENSRVKFNKGMIDTLSLTQVHNQYLNAQSGHTQAVVSLLNAGDKLDKALNRL